MPAYHSKFSDAKLKLANMALLPIRTTIKGPAPKESQFKIYLNISSLPPIFLPLAGNDIDIIDEAIQFFKANIFFKNFEIKVCLEETQSQIQNILNCFYFQRVKLIES